MNHSDIKVGMKVIALCHMDMDLTDDGMGISRCADKGDELIIRKVNSGFLNCISVSHEHITDRAFCVAPFEIADALINFGEQGK